MGRSAFSCKKKKKDKLDTIGDEFVSRSLQKSADGCSSPEVIPLKLSPKVTPFLSSLG